MRENKAGDGSVGRTDEGRRIFAGVVTHVDEKVLARRHLEDPAVVLGRDRHGTGQQQAARREKVSGSAKCREVGKGSELEAAQCEL